MVSEALGLDHDVAMLLIEGSQAEALVAGLAIVAAMTSRQGAMDVPSRIAGRSGQAVAGDDGFGLEVASMMGTASRLCLLSPSGLSGAMDIVPELHRSVEDLLGWWGSDRVLESLGPVIRGLIEEAEVHALAIELVVIAPQCRTRRTPQRTAELVSPPRDVQAIWWGGEPQRPIPWRARIPAIPRLHRPRWLRRRLRRLRLLAACLTAMSGPRATAADEARRNDLESSDHHDGRLAAARAGRERR